MLCSLTTTKDEKKNTIKSFSRKLFIVTDVAQPVFNAVLEVTSVYVASAYVWCLIRSHSVFAGEITELSQATAAHNLLEGFPQLLTPECINQRVNNGIAHDEDEVQVEMGHEANAVRIVRT